MKNLFWFYKVIFLRLVFDIIYLFYFLEMCFSYYLRDL